MEYNIYLDLLILRNFAADVVLLFSLQWMMGERTKKRRVLLAAAAGTAGAVGAFLFFPVFPPAGLFIAVVMSRIQYGSRGFLFHLKQGGLIYFMAFCLEGGIRWSNRYTGILLVLFFCFLIGKERKRRRNRAEVTLYFRGKSLVLQGFLDTGNLLVEPLTGKMVHIASYQAVKEILPECYRQAAEYYFQTGILESTKVSELQMYEFTFLSYHSIGKETGQLLGIRMDTAVFQNSAGKKTEEKAVIGLADQKIFLTGRCQMIMNGRLEL